MSPQCDRYYNVYHQETQCTPYTRDTQLTNVCTARIVQVLHLTQYHTHRILCTHHKKPYTSYTAHILHTLYTSHPTHTIETTHIIETIYTNYTLHIILTAFTKQILHTTLTIHIVHTTHIIHTQHPLNGLYFNHHPALYLYFD